MLMLQKLLLNFMLIHANYYKTSKGLSDEKISSVSRFTRPFIEYTNARINLKIIAICLLKTKTITKFHANSLYSL